MQRCSRGTRRCKASDLCVVSKPPRPLNANGTRFRCQREQRVNQRQCADRKCYPSRFFTNNAAKATANTIATTLVRSHNEKQDKQTLKAMKTALFAPFLPLIRPLSGVMQMTLLKKGDKKIFLIGEQHTNNFCRHRGMTPVAQIIENYLAQDNGVDFMIEMPNNYSPDYSLDEIRQIVTEPVNRHLTLDEHGNSANYKNPLQVIHMTRFLAFKSRARRGPTRVHWLEPHFPPVKAPLSTGDKLINAFMDFLNHYFEKRSFVETITYRRHRLHINSILRDATGFTPAWSDTATGTDFYRYGNDPKIAFFTQCYNLLSTSKFFRKCREGGPRQINFEIYRDAFLEMWPSQDDKSINAFYFHMQRFIMDMFTCCRIMKTDKENPIWYKNIVIYAGNWHVINYINILKKLHYTQYKLPHAIHFNSACR